MPDPTSAPSPAGGLEGELERQSGIQWERGKFFAAYEDMMGDYIVRSVLDHARKPSLLDFACGNGAITAMLAPHFERVVGVDASAPHVATAASAHPGIEFVQALAEDYRAAEPFSTITLLNLLEHVVDPVDLLARVSGNLARDGVLIVNVPNALAANRRIARMMGSLADEYELSPFDLEIAGHRRYYDTAKLVADLESAGLRVRETGGIFYKMLSQAQIDWLLLQPHWDRGEFGWGRVGAEDAKDWRKAFCDACYEYGKQRPAECNLIYAVAGR
ncbi:MAG TPA: class I SAM-dependent methyltransferase [Planctomycetota bacterium]